MTEPVIQKYDIIDSTNEEARRLVAQWNQSESNKSPFPDKIIIATTQTKGKGRLGRHWYSPPGNLYMTLIKTISVDALKLPQLSLVVGLSVYNVLKSYISKDHNVALKWPNDILVDGKKLGGILIETDFDDTKKSTICYIGIGLNRLSAPDTISYPTTCLLSYTSTPPEIDDLVSQIHAEFENLLEIWIQSDLENLREEWLWAAYGLGKPVSARVENGFMLYGRFVSLTSNGALIIEDDDQIQHTVTSGEINFMV